MRRSPVSIRVLLAVSCLAAAVGVAAAAAAATTWPYIGGAVDFHYQQFPFGAYRGDFSAVGLPLELPIDPELQPQAVGGLFTTGSDTTTAFWYAAVVQPDTTVDLAVLWVRRPGALPVGDYPVDVLGRTVLFGYVAGISDFTPPADPLDFDPAAWLDGLVCEHLFLAVSGTVHIVQVGELGWSGTFSGLAADPSPLAVTISGGAFVLNGVDVAVRNESWGALKASFR